MNETQSSPGGWLPHNQTWTPTEGHCRVASAEVGVPAGEGLRGKDGVLEEKLELAGWEERPGLLPQDSMRSFHTALLTASLDGARHVIPPGPSVASGGVLLVCPSNISCILQDSLRKSGSSSSLLRGLGA